ncbi:hypothetical protein CAOG_009564 [Capsaspora owczarzaki ATCC 30864]|uniref:DNA mismatch repair proteins mutS family domain-containing protein n=2 Tax=Capsaspora owczarzaki (strain ATCC 30864) TaxID=595528 RepID=A0A0D2U8P3_CAPO3|nr:hypothetical protein CAOG_009564 [Capsaspora owczarzaki ATCC 30864]
MLEDERFAQIRAKIDEAISDDTKFQKGILLMRSQKCFAVKPGINGLLDVARRTYTETVEDIYNLTSQYATKFVLPLKTAFSASRGFYITTPVSMVPGGPAQTSGSARPANAAADDSDDDDDDDDDADDEVGNEVNSDNRARQPASSSRPALGNFGLPKIFQQVVRSKKTLSFTSSDMIKLNNRVNESLQETYLMSNAVLANVLLDIRDMISSLYKLTEVLAILDMLQSFAHHATLSRQAVRPEFTDTLAVKAGGHTIIEHLNSADEASVVTNDVFMSSGCNFQIITGPNMSGKSTYLRQIAIMQVVAQMGCLVPAEYASLRISDHLFSRIGSDDHIESNSSTFMLEMRETAYILQHATNRSLIIIDELGRGTSAQEAVGICHAICEYLLSLKAFTFFATHFEELTLLDSLYPNVANFHLEVQNLGSDSARPVFTHVIRKGPSKETHYGIKLAEVAGFPAQVLERARNALSVIETQGQPDESAAPEFAVDRAVFQLASKLVQVAKESRMDEQSLRAYLLTLQAQHSWLQALL